MAEIQFFNIHLDDPNATEEELVTPAATAYVQQFLELGEVPTQAQIDDAIALWEHDQTETGEKNQFLIEAQAEIDFLDAIIPTVDTMTAGQVRSLAKRLAQENRAIIKALKYAVKRLKL